MPPKHVVHLITKWITPEEIHLIGRDEKGHYSMDVERILSSCKDYEYRDFHGHSY